MSSDSATPAVGSVLQMMPATGSVAFTSREYKHQWSRPLIGFVVVVTWVQEMGREGYRDDVATYKTRVMPLILDDDDTPDTTLNYLRGGDDGTVSWTVKLT